MLTVTEACAVGSALETAVSVTEGGSGGTLGAMHRSPFMWPHAVPEHPGPVTFHSTAFFLVPLTVALNISEPPTGTSNLSGAEILTAIDVKSCLSGL